MKVLHFALASSDEVVRDMATVGPNLQTGPILGAHPSPQHTFCLSKIIYFLTGILDENGKIFFGSIESEGKRDGTW